MQSDQSRGRESHRVLASFKQSASIILGRHNSVTDMDTPSRLELEEILSTNGVERRHLNRECLRVVAVKIAEKVLDWKMLGYVLGLPREKIAAIDRDNQTGDQRKVALFDEWKSIEGSEATYLKLAKALYDRNLRDIVELLCDLFQTHEATPTEMVSAASPEEQPNVQAGADNTALERIAPLENKFQALHSQFVSELTSQGTVSVDTILQALTMLPVTLKTEYDESVQQRLTVLEGATSVSRLFLRLNPLFTFIDYPGLLHYLISRFGSETLKKDMTSYEQEIQVFMRRTTVAELMDHWPGRQVSNYVTIRVKFDGDPHNYTLQKLNDFRRKFACELRLSEFIFTLIGSERSNSFIALWAVHPVITHVIIKNSGQIGDKFCQCEGVMSLYVGVTQLYPSKGLSVDILHPLCQLSSKWCNCQTDPNINPTAQPVFMDGSVYTRGTSDGKRTPWKLSTSTSCWSQLPPPKGVEIKDYVITTYQGRLIWIGGLIYKSKYEHTPNRKIFVLKDVWTEDTDFIPPLPENVTSSSQISASSNGKNLIVVTSTRSHRFKLLIFDGHEWIEKDGPGQECTIGDIIVHNGTVYLIEPSDHCRYCHTTSLKSLLAANEPGWRSLDFPLRHSNLTVAGGHVVIVTNSSPYALYVLGFSTPSNSWIELKRVECKTNLVIMPSIVGTDDGRLLLMGRIKVIPNDPSQMLFKFPKFDIYELTAKVTPYNPEKQISLSAVLKLELYVNIQVLTQLYEQQKLGTLMERAGFSQSQMPLPLAILYNMSPAAKCIKSWLDENSPSLQPTWKNFLHILQEPGINLGKTAGQIESYLKIPGYETELSDQAPHAPLEHERGQLSLTAPPAKRRRIIHQMKGLQAHTSEYQEIKLETADDELTAEEQLSRLKTALDQISLQSQHYREKDINSHVDQCIEMCEVVRKKFAVEKKQLDEHIKQLEEQLHQSRQGSSGGIDKTTSALTERHIPALLRQLKKHAARWKEIGTHLEFLPSELDNIEARPNLTQGAPKSWLGAMLQEWIQWAPEDSRGSTNFANLEDLKDALREAGLGTSAHELKL